MIDNCLALLLVRAPEAPSVLETTVMKKGAATIVHLLSFVRERRGDLDIVEDALPLLDLPISIRTDRRPKHVELVPHRARHPARRPRHAGVPMITMRSDWWNADSYYPWIDPLVEAAFGAEIDLHWDLYLQTHAHRLQHEPGCEAYPSPPSHAPFWAILAKQVPSPPEVILETGTGIGYSTVLIAEAFPRSRLFTVERDALHRRIAEQTFADAGVADQITIVPSMDEAPIERSDLVFVDGPVVDPARLRNGCVFIDDAVKRTFRNAAIAALQPLRDPTDDTDDSLRLARQRYRHASADLLREARHSGRGPSR